MLFKIKTSLPEESAKPIQAELKVSPDGKILRVCVDRVGINDITYSYIIAEISQKGIRKPGGIHSDLGFRLNCNGQLYPVNKDEEL